VTGTRPERPVLATVVCIWEVFIVVLAIVTHYTVNHLHNSRPPGQSLPPVHPVSPLQTAASWLTYTLAIAAAVTLWRMHRSAYIFLAGRFCISLVSFVVGALRIPSFLATTHPHQHAINLSAIVWAVGAIAIADLALDASIAWYAYDITTPEAISPPEPEAPAYT
jgi:hypothetical protein